MQRALVLLSYLLAVGCGLLIYDYSFELAMPWFFAVVPLAIALPMTLALPDKPLLRSGLLVTANLCNMALCWWMFSHPLTSIDGLSYSVLAITLLVQIVLTQLAGLIISLLHKLWVKPR